MDVWQLLPLSNLQDGFAFYRIHREGGAVKEHKTNAVYRPTRESLLGIIPRFANESEAR